ncbi:mammalian cell entry protein, partial [Mycobacterium sp. ITM-2017-0098]
PQNVIYSDPALAPGGGGTAPQEIPPAVSAYTGAGDIPPPAGWSNPPQPPGAYAPHGLPANPSPALYPGAPVPPGVPAPPTTAPGPLKLEDMLLPAEAAPAARSSEGTP